jgi:hypothetical protein
MAETKPAASPATSDDPVFDDIRPCRDSEVRQELLKIVNDKTVIDSIMKFRHPVLAKRFGFMFAPMVKAYLARAVSSIHTIDDFQKRVADFMGQVSKSTTDGVTYEGFEGLEKGKGYLFISNHRDISLDPAFIDMALYLHGLDTVRIAIGDNLLRIPAATSLMRLNKSFLVKRSLKSPREKLVAFTKLSEYIGLSISEGHSIWIAQREGRAKDGDDRTESAVLKMIGLNGRKKRQKFGEYMSSLNIVPVALSYEYDPNDEAKARELYERDRNGGEYHKESLEDIDTITRGIRGYKGRICIRAGKPISGGFEDADELAAIIDRFVWRNYEIYPSALAAAGAEGVDPGKAAEFERRLSACPSELRGRVRSMYAMPYKNRLMSLKEGND